MKRTPERSGPTATVVVEPWLMTGLTTTTALVTSPKRPVTGVGSLPHPANNSTVSTSKTLFI
ncbi:hypothetical protein F0U61_24645 [Archangium violaceum]|nr:hypothetical protein F0U61_24645 [Archangium violaceum]